MLDFWVDGQLLRRAGLWLAIVDVGGDDEIGFGSSAQEALEMALVSLGQSAANALLAEIRDVEVRLSVEG
jgi:hypothetical protein